MPAPSRILSASRVVRTGGLMFHVKRPSYVSIPHNDAQNVTGDFTIVLWLYFKDPAQPASFIHKGTWPAIINYFFANQNITTNHYFVFTDTNSYLLGSGTIPKYSWSHWICDYVDGYLMEVYRNNVLIHYRSDVSGYPRPSTEPIELGKYGSSYFTGILDRVMVYNRKLSDQEKSDIYNKDAFIKDGLVLYLDFTEGEGSTVYDKSGNGFNGTIYNADWVIKKARRVLST
jgi:hypothetical protein